MPEGKQERSCSPFSVQVASFTVVHSPNEQICSSVVSSVFVASSFVVLGVCVLLPLSQATKISEQASVIRHTSKAILIFFFIFLLSLRQKFSVQIKKCANRSQRTEKRKLQLSPNKNYDMSIALQSSCEICVFTEIYATAFKK